MYKISISLLLLIGLISCSEDNSVIDTGFPVNPSSFTSLTLLEYDFDTDTLNIPQAGDKRETDPVAIPLNYSFRAVPAPGTSLGTARITVQHENGGSIVIDTTITGNSDNTFAGALTLRIARNDVGDYDVRVTGKDGRDVQANAISSKISVIYGKYPPELFNLSAPDSIKRPQTDTTFILSVSVKDKSGQNDIKTVFFSSFKPDGSPTTSAKLVMFDDGSNGDAVAGDGIFSRGVTLESTNALGTYRFEIQAFDRSNLAAAPIVHYLTVY